jgi:hypothetical protein
MCSRSRVLGTLLGLLGATACSQAPNNELPATVMTALKDLTEQCAGVDGTPHFEDAVRRVDLNGDLADDFVLYAGWIVCENAWSIYGDREKSLVVFASDGRGGAAEAFDDAVYDVKTEKAGNATQLWLTTSAEACGRAPAATFAEETFCDRAIAWNAAAARFEYAPVSTVRIIQ